MFGLGITEIVIIVVVLGIVIFGGKKLAGLAKSAGRAGGEFKKGRMEVKSEIKEMQAKESVETSTEASAEPVVEENINN